MLKQTLLSVTALYLHLKMKIKVWRVSTDEDVLRAWNNDYAIISNEMWYLLLKNQFAKKVILKMFVSLNSEIFENILELVQKYLVYFESNFVQNFIFVDETYKK